VKLLNFGFVYSSVSKTVFFAGLFWLRNVTMDPHILADVTTECPGDRYPKLKIYTPTDSNKLQIHTSSIHDRALHDLTLIKMTVVRFVGTGGFLMRYSNCRTK